MNADKQLNFDEWCKRDRWAIIEGAMLLLEKEWDGTTPPMLPAGLSQRFNQIIRAACDDLGDRLPTEFKSKFSAIPGSVPDNCFILVRPGDFIDWAERRHFRIPPKLRSAARECQRTRLQGIQDQRDAQLEDFLRKIEHKADQAGKRFDRAKMPGTKDQFKRLIKKHCPDLERLGGETLNDYMTRAHCKFSGGRNPRETDIWKALRL